MATVPAELITRLRTISDIGDGERAYAFLDGVYVDTKGQAWLSRGQPIRRNIPSVDMAEITRSGNDYHLKIPKKRYRAMDLSADDNWYIKVASVTLYRRTWWNPLNWWASHARG